MFVTDRIKSYPKMYKKSIFSFRTSKPGSNSSNLIVYVVINSNFYLISVWTFESMEPGVLHMQTNIC